MCFFGKATALHANEGSCMIPGSNIANSSTKNMPKGATISLPLKEWCGQLKEGGAGGLGGGLIPLVAS